MPRSKSILRLRLSRSLGLELLISIRCLSAAFSFGFSFSFRFAFRPEFSSGSRTGQWFGLGFAGSLCWASAKNCQWLRVDDAGEDDVDVPVPVTSQPPQKTDKRPTRREERVQLELLLLLLLLIRQLLLLTKNQFNWINFVEFPWDAAALSVHIRFSTLFPCHFRAQILFRRCRVLSSFILRQEFAQFIILFFSIFMGFLFRKNFLGMHKSNCKWWISIAFGIFILDFFCSARDEIFTSVWNEVREKRVPEQRRQHVYLARSFIHN